MGIVFPASCVDVHDELGLDVECIMCWRGSAWICGSGSSGNEVAAVVLHLSICGRPLFILVGDVHVSGLLTVLSSNGISISPVLQLPKV